MHFVESVETLRHEIEHLRGMVADRTARLVEVSRQVARSRRVLGKMTREQVDGELKAISDTATRTWPKQLPCASCGAPIITVRTAGPGSTDGLMNEHPDDSSCVR